MSAPSPGTCRLIVSTMDKAKLVATSPEKSQRNFHRRFRNPTMQSVSVTRALNLKNLTKFSKKTQVRTARPSMEPVDMRELLEQVRGGGLSIEAALEKLHAPAVADLGYAHVDLQRQRRCGFPEVIFCQSKTPPWVAGVVDQLIAAGQDCLATRVSDEQAAVLAERFPSAVQDRVARTFWLPSSPRTPAVGQVVVITAGTSDLPVAREA